MRVAYRQRALDDLDSIYDYSAAVWGRKQARRYLNDLKSGIAALAAGKRVGLRADYVRQDILRHLVRSHMIYFEDNSSTLLVIRILPVSMDPERHVEDQGETS